MDNSSKRKSYSLFSNSKVERVKNKKELRLRLIKLTNNYFKPRCEHYINNIRSFNIKIMEYSGGKRTVEKAIKDNKHFHFGKKKDHLIHLTDLSSYNIDKKPFLKNLKDEFTKEEIEIIKKNKEYYLTNELLKENISMFNVPPLYQIINKEEADEKKGAKVFHNLNYFNKRRRNSVMNINNLIQKKTSGILNDNIEPVHKRVIKYENNVTESHDKIKDNHLNLIEREIRQGIKRKNEENKNFFITKRLIKDLEIESKNEVDKFLKNKKEYELKNKISLDIEAGNKKKNLPSLRVHTFAKNNNKNTIEGNTIKIKRKKSFSKEKRHDLTKKIIDYEQKLIRDVNRRIKNNYEKKNRKSFQLNEI